MAHPDPSGRPDDQQALREALKRAAVALKQAQVPFALAGGYATWARGGPEPEHDADVVVLPESVDDAVRALDEAGLEVVRPPEDWLVKAFADGAMVDVIFRISGRPVTREVLERADVLDVLSVHMPVLEATDVLVSKLAALSEQSCDLRKVLPTARALREQIDWKRVESGTADNDYAAATLYLLRRLQVAPDG